VTRLVGAVLRHAADIGTGGERASGAEQHDAAHRVVRLDRGELVVEARPSARPRARSAPSAVQRQDDDGEVGEGLAEDGCVIVHAESSGLRQSRRLSSRG